MIRNLARPVPRVEWAIRNHENFLWRSWPYWTIAAIVFLAWIAYSQAYPVPIFPFDDAYIVIHNASVLLSGHDLNYAGSSTLTGTTSSVHLTLVAFLTLFLRPLVALATAAWLSTLLYGLGLVRLARVNGASQAQALLLALIGLLAGQTPHQLLNGLETGLMLAAVTWGLVLLSDPSQRPRWMLPALCGTLPFVRPDLAPLAILFLAVQAARHWRIEQNRPAFLRRIGTDIGLALLFTLPWALWYWREIGTLLPSTVAAKRYFFAEAGGAPDLKWGVVFNCLSLFGAELGLLTFFAVFLVRSRLGWAGLAFGTILVAAYYAQFPGALNHYERRYLFPLLPFVLLGAVYALCHAKRAVRLGATAALTVALGQSLLTAPAYWAQHRSGCGNTVRNLDGVAGWCNRNLPGHTTLLIHDAGYIACKTDFPLIDLVGLKTPSSVPYHARLTYPSNGSLRGEAIDQIARRGHPDYLLVLDGWENIYHIAAGLKAAGWSVRLVNADYSYKVYALRPPSVILKGDGSARPK